MLHVDKLDKRWISTYCLPDALWCYPGTWRLGHKYIPMTVPFDTTEVVHVARPPFLVWAFNLALIMLSFYLRGRSEPPCTENLDFGYVAKWKGCDFSDAPCHGYVPSEALVSLFPSSLAIDDDQCCGWIMDNCYDVHVSNNVSSRLCEDNGYMPDWAVRSTLAFHSGLDSFRTWVSGLVPEDSVFGTVFDWAAYIIGG